VLLTGKYRGFRLGAYVLRDQIGQGGIGSVFLARHETLRRTVAIKVLAGGEKGATSKVNVERFLREAQSAAASDHPNIVRIFDVARLGETHYLVVEYVDGQTLDQVPTARGPVASGRAVEYASRQHRPIESVIIDEGFGCQGRQVMIQELQNLRGQLHCILLVSHQEEVANALATATASSCTTARRA
jgi:hypothetical protein